MRAYSYWKRKSCCWPLSWMLSIYQRTGQYTSLCYLLNKPAAAKQPKRIRSKFSQDIYVWALLFLVFCAHVQYTSILTHAGTDIFLQNDISIIKMNMRNIEKIKGNWGTEKKPSFSVVLLLLLLADCSSSTQWGLCIYMGRSNFNRIMAGLKKNRLQYAAKRPVESLITLSEGKRRHLPSLQAYNTAFLCSAVSIADQRHTVSSKCIGYKVLWL